MNEFNIRPNYIPSSFNFSQIQRFYRGISDNLCVPVFVVSVHTISVVILCVYCLCECCGGQRGNAVFFVVDSYIKLSTDISTTFQLFLCRQCFFEYCCCCCY